MALPPEKIQLTFNFTRNKKQNSERPPALLENIIK